MEIRRIASFELALPVAGINVGNRTMTATPPKRESILHQAFSLSDLLKGDFWAKGISPDILLNYGDFGIGAFGPGFIGGEGIIFGGQLYSITEPRNVRRIVASDSIELEDRDHSPFMMLTRFNPEDCLALEMANIKSYDELKLLLRTLTNHEPDSHYAVFISGLFGCVEFQCVQPATQAGQTFAEVDKKRECFEEVNAHLVGFQVGPSQSNLPGLHLHGLGTLDTELPPTWHCGGHVNELQIRSALVLIQKLGPLERLL